MLTTTPGRILIDEALPPDLRDPTRRLDKGGIQRVFQALAERHPGAYREVSHRLLKLGGDVAFAHGGLSFGLEHLRPARAALETRRAIGRELQSILEDRTLDDDARERAIVALADRHRPGLEKAVFDESLAEGNPLAQQVVSGVRGNKSNIVSLRGGDLLYADHRGNPVPIPVLRSYSEGLSPGEYWAGAYGARKGVVDVKLGVAKSGYVSKQLLGAAHRLVVTARDADKSGEDAADRGLPVDAADPDNEGALLARPAAGFGRNTVLTPRVLKAIRDAGVGQLLVRSPLVGGPADGGLYARDAGVRERGRLAPVGDYVGHAAAQALGEKTTQLTLASKHSGGVAGARTSPFESLNKLLNPPKVYPEAAAHAEVDGHVTRVEEAPQGGHYVHIGGVRHYVHGDHAVLVRPGDAVEAGDVLSEGVPNPAAIVRHKGIGEGRRYFTGALRDLFKGAGLSAHRRNIEVVARGLINHVVADDELPGGYLPGDHVPYSALEAAWEPRPGHAAARPEAAVGKYLEAPALHHTIGTRLSRSMARELSDWGIRKVLVHPEPPPFHPALVPARSALSVDPDPFVRHLGSGLEKGTLEAVHRSRSSDPAGTSFVSALMDPPTFGLRGPTAGWDPNDDDDDEDDD